MSETIDTLSVPELLDGLVERHPTKDALCRQLGVPRSSLYHWLSGERFPHPRALSSIHRLAIQHELIAPDTPLPERPELDDELSRDDELSPEPMSLGFKVVLGAAAAGLAGLFAWAMWPIRSA